MLEFCDAILGHGEETLVASRNTVIERLGSSGLVDAAGVAAYFNALDRIADATGTPLEEDYKETTEELREELGINEYEATRSNLE